MTFEEARDAILGHFRDAWLASATSQNVPVNWPYGSDGDGPPTTSDGNGNPTSWARIRLRHATGGQASLANHAGVRTWDRAGLVTVSLFTPRKDGVTPYRLAKVITDAFEGASPGGVWIRNVSPPNEVGPDGAWEMTNIRFDFEYRETK